MNTINDVSITEIPKVHDERGVLAVIEKDIIPFNIKRVYYLYDVPSDSFRGGHAHKDQQSVVIALSGSFDVIVDDGKSKKRIMLNKPNQALYIPTNIWREIDNFSSGAVCLVLASTTYDENEYIRDYKDFILSVR
ncbi:sugar 3,4-ketoisomerase [Winogradskyella sp. UBA3174]|uniref:sugar 3,4-ketoisomerase n=1 Tax=Winogradskyella sp. UBA3174 TaxID=1947785 RepID=UPI0025E33673|nr:FdtA/QdtA family cupin domain-containing protein [Winogradskyella sp. UBA3174]|tara:strand:- start:31369 stop:31773 length:405 start_codon:yes stop_codon:yes gene_type:complete